MFDVVTQLKAESDIQLRPGRDFPPNHGRTTISTHVNDGSNSNTAISPPNYDHEVLISTLESGDDLRARVYEGGFKTWECGVDLASYLASYLVMDERVGDSDLERWLMDGGVGGGGGIFRCEDEKGEFSDGCDGGFDVVELGVGSGIPSLVLLNYMCRRRKEKEQGEEKKRRQRRERDESRRGDGGATHPAQGSDGTKDGQGGVRFILCDYNIEVLRLLTGANVLLQLGQNGLLTNSGDGFCKDDVRTIGGEDIDQGEGEGEGEFDLDSVASGHRRLDETVILAMLRQIGISSIDFISGAWGDPFVDLILPPPSHPSRSPSPSTKMVSNPIQGSASDPASASIPTRQKRPVLILCSETIYSPSSLHAFTSTLLSLLRRSGDPGRSMALVAAKKIYFGIGGGVDDFTAEAQRAGGVVGVVKEFGGGSSAAAGGKGGGVGRVILKVTLEKRGSFSS